jgi:hypothetical protein
MATTLTTYFYSGANVVDAEQTFICYGPHCYATAYIDVAIFYGSYIGADVVPSTQPKNLSPLMNVEFNAQIYKFVGGQPTSKFAAATLIARQDIYDLDNPRDCLGTKFTFQGPAMENCVDDFCLVWSTNRVEMPYGPDMIYIAAQNGVSNNWEPCD